MIIFGAGSLGLQVCDQLLTNGVERSDIIFFDKNTDNHKNIPSMFKYIDKFEELKDLLQKHKCFIAIGHPGKREKVTQKIQSIGGKFESIKSNFAHISNFSIINNPHYIQPGVCIAHNTTIGDSAVIHANSIIAHDVNIGNYLSIAQNVNIMKNVKIGDLCFIGSNATIMPNIRIGNKVIIGAHSIVKSDMQDYSSIT